MKWGALFLYAVFMFMSGNYVTAKSISIPHKDEYLWVSVTEAKKIIAGTQVYHPEFFTFSIASKKDAQTQPLYRYYNKVKSIHFWTVSKTEGDGMPGFEYEGIVGFVAARPGDAKAHAVYRYYNPRNGRYFYTPDFFGENALQHGYTVKQAVAFYAWGAGEANVNIIRLYSPLANPPRWTQEDSTKWNALLQVR